jgi:hemoglobin
MRQVLATAHALVGDLADRENVEGLLRRFYGWAFRDDMLSEPFAGICFGRVATAVTLCTRTNACIPAPHDQRAISHGWLTLWTATVDEMYQGPAAERAKVQAARIATSCTAALPATLKLTARATLDAPKPPAGVKFSTLRPRGWHRSPQIC